MLYACWSKDRKVLDSSNSDGLFYEAAAQIISLEGYVYGVTWNENNVLIHIGTNEFSELKRLQRSKFTQSDTNNVYVDVREKLQEGIKVLFVGAPCQLAGLYKYE